MQIESDVIQQFKGDKTGFQYVPHLLVDGKPTGISGVEPAAAQTEALAIAAVHADTLLNGLADGSIRDVRDQ